MTDILKELREKSQKRKKLLVQTVSYCFEMLVYLPSLLSRSHNDTCHFSLGYLMLMN